MPGARGEVEIAVPDQDRTITLLYTNRALVEAERMIGRSVFDVVNTTNGFPQVTEIMHLFRAGWLAARRDGLMTGPPPDMNDCYRVVDSVGLTRVMTVVLQGVGEVLMDPAGSDEGN